MMYTGCLEYVKSWNMSRVNHKVAIQLSEFFYVWATGYIATIQCQDIQSKSQTKLSELVWATGYIALIVHTLIL